MCGTAFCEGAFSRCPTIQLLTTHDEKFDTLKKATGMAADRPRSASSWFCGRIFCGGKCHGFTLADMELRSYCQKASEL